MITLCCPEQELGIALLLTASAFIAWILYSLNEAPKYRFIAVEQKINNETKESNFDKAARERQEAIDKQDKDTHNKLITLFNHYVGISDYYINQKSYWGIKHMVMINMTTPTSYLYITVYSKKLYFVDEKCGAISESTMLTVDEFNELENIFLLRAKVIDAEKLRKSKECVRAQMDKLVNKIKK